MAIIIIPASNEKATFAVYLRSFKFIIFIVCNHKFPSSTLKNPKKILLANQKQQPKRNNLDLSKMDAVSSIQLQNPPQPNQNGN